MFQCLSDDFKHPIFATEGATVERWWEGHDHVQDGHGGQEEDEQQHPQIEVIRSGSFEDPRLRNVATHHSPALEVHGCVEPKDIDAWEAGSEEGAHPDHSLIEDQSEDIATDVKFGV